MPDFFSLCFFFLKPYLRHCFLFVRLQGGCGVIFIYDITLIRCVCVWGGVPLHTIALLCPPLLIQQAGLCPITEIFPHDL